ncbi:uncharacterized protein LOC131237278 [Magnolia sinica]|uniref:uncharacterized protein LOC131237278 n=1 Tax=Magnolia sinica TaxID=86752 RepID=UPI00265AAF3B|nr:uncharacterized protein LOC131237278 [Magnolia sinica]
MSWTNRAWIVATSVGAVEALKDQGFCRRNYALRSLHQQAKKNIRSYTQAQRLSPSLDSSSSSSSSSSNIAALKRRRDREEKQKQSEESLRKVMYLSCWGPN